MITIQRAAASEVPEGTLTANEIVHSDGSCTDHNRKCFLRSKNVLLGSIAGLIDAQQVCGLVKVDEGWLGG